MYLCVWNNDELDTVFANDCCVCVVTHVSPVDGDVLSLQKEPLAAVMHVHTGKPHYNEKKNAQTDLRQMRTWTAGQIEQ